MHCKPQCVLMRPVAALSVRDGLRCRRWLCGARAVLALAPQPRMAAPGGTGPVSVPFNGLTPAHAPSSRPGLLKEGASVGVPEEN